MKQVAGMCLHSPWNKATEQVMREWELTTSDLQLPKGRYRSLVHDKAELRLASVCARRRDATGSTTHSSLVDRYLAAFGAGEGIGKTRGYIRTLCNLGLGEAAELLMQLRLECAPLHSIIAKNYRGREPIAKQQARALCPCCKAAPETVTHLLLECPAYAEQRQQLEVCMRELCPSRLRAYMQLDGHTSREGTGVPATRILAADSASPASCQPNAHGNRRPYGAANPSCHAPCCPAHGCPTAGTRSLPCARPSHVITCSHAAARATPAADTTGTGAAPQEVSPHRGHQAHATCCQTHQSPHYSPQHSSWCHPYHPHPQDHQGTTTRALEPDAWPSLLAATAHSPTPPAPMPLPCSPAQNLHHLICRQAPVQVHQVPVCQAQRTSDDCRHRTQEGQAQRTLEASQPADTHPTQAPCAGGGPAALRSVAVYIIAVLRERGRIRGLLHRGVHGVNAGSQPTRQLARRTHRHNINACIIVHYCVAGLREGAARTRIPRAVTVQTKETPQAFYRRKARADGGDPMV